MLWNDLNPPEEPSEDQRQLFQVIAKSLALGLTLPEGQKLDMTKAATIMRNSHRRKNS